MDTSSHSKPSSSSASPSSHSPSPASVAAPRKTRDSGLCMTQDIPEIPAHCIDNLNSHQLGKGTYGVVEKTRYRRSRNHEYKPAAIKYSSPIHLNTLIREAKVMWAFRDDTNIRKIYGLYRCPRHGQGVVMEYMDCGSMAELIYDRKSVDYTIDHVASWLFQLASAVHTFHSNDQVHRDLKLQNMLLCDRYRTMKLCDFGTFTTMHQSMTSNRGTPITMAPEVFRCEDYNTKSDICSIGIIMWQIIARNHPYNRNLSVPGLLYNVATASLRPPDLECNPILSGFYKRCWHDDPDTRPTAAESLEYFGLLKTTWRRMNRHEIRDWASMGHAIRLGHSDTYGLFMRLRDNAINHEAATRRLERIQVHVNVVRMYVQTQSLIEILAHIFAAKQNFSNNGDLRVLKAEVDALTGELRAFGEEHGHEL